ncbi:hypothetical protein [Nonomuraea insulae]|uniref:PE domain-containing protein n=1 Tax=Nonomuraea insulae TaxID=1616787 RepID=A0ABW1CLP0_9ACTN
MSRPSDPGGSPPPELHLPSDFPGLTGDDGGGPYIEHSRVKSIVSSLRENLGSLRGAAPSGMSATWSGAGTVNEVSYRGNVGPAETGKWEAATAFGDNLTQAHTVFNDSYGVLVDNVEKWVDAVEKAIVNYEKFQRDSSA